MFPVQTTLLRLTGFLPLSNTHDIATYSSRPFFTRKRISTVLAATEPICFLLGNLYVCAINAANLLYGFFHPASSHAAGVKDTESTILLFMQLMPFFMIATRSLVVLLLVFRNRAHWSKLIRQGIRKSCDFSYHRFHCGRFITGRLTHFHSFETVKTSQSAHFKTN